MAHATLLGDLREQPEGSFDGWCWAPDRPQARLIVDLLVNDTLAVSMVAAVFRRDLQASGYGDGRHGFVMRLPANLAELQADALITARERRSGQVFGRVLRSAPGGMSPGGAQLDAAEQSVEAMWQLLAEARARTQALYPLRPLQVAFAGLAGMLAARAAGWPVVVPPPADRRRPVACESVLPLLARPDITLAMPAGRAAAALRRIAALAPALALARAELLVIDCGDDPMAAYLPSRVANLRYLRAPASLPADAANLAAEAALGDRLIWLGAAPELPSAAALLALAHALAGQPPALWLGPAAMAAVARVAAPVPARLRLPAPLGLTLCLDRALLGQLGPLDALLDDGAALECADLALKARLLGIAVYGVAEPVPGGGAIAPCVAAPAPAGASPHAAHAGFAARWGAPDPADLGA